MPTSPAVRTPVGPDRSRLVDLFPRKVLQGDVKGMGCSAGRPAGKPALLSTAVCKRDHTHGQPGTGRSRRSSGKGGVRCAGLLNRVAGARKVDGHHLLAAPAIAGRQMPAIFPPRPSQRRCATSDLRFANTLRPETYSIGLSYRPNSRATHRRGSHRTRHGTDRRSTPSRPRGRMPA